MNHLLGRTTNPTSLGLGGKRERVLSQREDDMRRMPAPSLPTVPHHHPEPPRTCLMVNNLDLEHRVKGTAQRELSPLNRQNNLHHKRLSHQKLSQSEGMDTSLQYGAVGSDPSMDGTEEHSNHMLPNKYDQPVIPG
ncbi:hypothetical protein E2C01_061337 [Portunus trituberculatus]|uniref:Uncharacterized protein n=1 Tax=Portunus trituberculatus TaxID=210409 RepID=A0A5B7H3K9_PORTR|nr:hypothetical protein [Portunus trituberculatus]